MEAAGTSLPTCHSTRRGPISIICFVEILFAIPLKLCCPSFVATPVAQIIHFPCIQKHLNTFMEKVWDHEMVVDHPVASCRECKIDSAIARGPLFIHTELLLDLLCVQPITNVIEVVTKGR